MCIVQWNFCWTSSHVKVWPTTLPRHLYQHSPRLSYEGHDFYVPFEVFEVLVVVKLWSISYTQRSFQDPFQSRAVFVVHINVETAFLKLTSIILLKLLVVVIILLVFQSSSPVQIATYYVNAFHRKWTTSGHGQKVVFSSAIPQCLHETGLKYPCYVIHRNPRIYGVQWTPSNPDTLGTGKSGLLVGWPHFRGYHALFFLKLNFIKMTVEETVIATSA